MHKMLQKFWSTTEGVIYKFSRSSVKFQGHKWQKIIDFDPNKGFQTVTPVWIHWWPINDTQSSKQHRRGALLLFNDIRQISMSHGREKSLILTRIGGFRKTVYCINQVCIYRLLWIDKKTGCCIKEVLCCFARSSITFQSHTRLEIPDFNPNCAFPDYNSSLYSPKALKWFEKFDVIQKRCPIFFKVIHQISHGTKSHAAKDHRFWPDLNVVGM